LPNKPDRPRKTSRRKEKTANRFSLQSLFVKEPQDTSFLILVLMLLVIGLIMLYSASFPSSYFEKGNPNYYILKQAAFAGAGILAMLFVSKLDYHLLKYLIIPLMFTTLILLGLVLLPNVGVLRNNARRWINIFGISVQPSEIAKLAIILDFSASIARKKTLMREFQNGILPYAAILCLYGGLIALEPHLSGAILLFAIGASLMFVGGIDRKYVLIGLAVAGLVAWVILSGKLPYGQSRIAMWKDPFIDATGDGYQLSQSIITIGSGGLFGLGLGKSRQKFLFLPEEHNDFIFAIVCEELGLVGATIIMIVFSALIIRGYVIARNAKDRFGSLLCVGVTTHIALQTFLNIAVVSGLVPTTGVSLPFFSYGGSALLTQLFEMGIVLSVSRQMKGNYYLSEKEEVDRGMSVEQALMMEKEDQKKMRRSKKHDS